MKVIEEHLERVSVENAKDWRDFTNSIITYASARCVKIGINSHGDWVVVDNGVHLFEQDIEGAVAKYHELVKG